MSPEEQPQTQASPPPEPKLTEEQKAAQAAQEVAAKAQAEQHARVVAEHEAQQKAAAARTRYAQIVDAIRTGATAEELEQASDALKPIAQAVSSRL